MTLLNPTPEELRARHEARLADVALRAERWQKRRRRFIRMATIAGALLLVVSARMAAFGGSMSWPAYLVLPALGGLLAWCIASVPFGVLRGMLLYGFGSFVGWLLCSLAGWWNQASGAGDGVSGAGGLILMMMGWLAWIVIGGVVGLLSEQFDNDSQQI